MNIFVPCGGKYSRFPKDGLPKYLRPMNDMRPMLSWALDGVRHLTKNPFKIAVRKADEDRWNVSSILPRYENCEIQILENETCGPADTICRMINYFNPEGPTMFHDCDCGWTSMQDFDDSISGIVVAWRETAIGDRGTKSWVWTINEGKIISISEKSSPSNWYCCGGYIIKNPSSFIDHYNYVDLPEIYCSHVISSMIEDGEEFYAITTNEPIDWGTFEKYVEYRRQTIIYLFDVDGVILNSCGPYGDKLWKDAKPLEGAVQKISDLKKKGAYIVLFTSRPVGDLYETLKKYNIPYDKLIDGIPNGPRKIINDYAESNPYPTAEAINTKRDSASWIDML